jgi:hypothetical protein
MASTGGKARSTALFAAQLVVGGKRAPLPGQSDEWCARGIVACR